LNHNKNQKLESVLNALIFIKLFKNYQQIAGESESICKATNSQDNTTEITAKTKTL
jgi:hypothetical protein